ncbi:MAG: hypothetical protein IH899_18750 [Planctomycetes bacterium]|nr:hypothetical protein [Planctomycetota bacterium]
MIATLDSSYYNDPSLLAEAQAPTTADVTATISGSTLTIDPAVNFVGSFQVTVAATDGVDTVRQTFNVTVTNNAPTLSPIADQTISHTTDTISIVLPGSDADGDPLTYSVEISGDPLAQRAYDLDQQYGIEAFDGSIANNYWLNYRGANERYLVGFFILPNGELYRWGGSIEASTMVATLDSNYYNDPSLLSEAQAPTAIDVTATISGSTLTIDPALGFVGSFQVTVAATDGVETVQQTFSVTVTNNSPVLTSIGDQTMASGDDSVTVNLSASDADGDALTYSVEIGADAITQLAYNLDQTLGLEAFAGSIENNYWLNYRGANEKYLVGHFILPNGELYRWGGSIAASTLIATLDSTFYNDPALLANAQLPSSANVIASLNGSTLTLNPDASYPGRFQVTVSVSDGFETTRETFTVHREQIGSSSSFLIVFGGRQSIGNSSTISPSETEQSETDTDAISSTSLAGMFMQPASSVDSFQSSDEIVETRFELDSPTSTSGRLSDVVKTDDSGESGSSLDNLDEFLESLPGLESISDLDGSDEFDGVSDDDSDDLDKALDRIFSESDGVQSDSSLLEKLMIG